MYSTILNYKGVRQELGEYADESAVNGTPEEARATGVNIYKKRMLELKSEAAKWLHDNYELIAEEKGWDTQDKCKVEFDDLPHENKETMLELAERILESD